MAAAGTVRAQVLVPYFGKNNVKYDTFHWKTYKTEHFEFFFYGEEEEHLQRVASMAESAYDKISADLQHEVEFKIPLIFFKTQSEFEQVNYLQVYEGILGVAEPEFNRMAFAIDVPSDKLQDLIAHELTHVFEFSMLFGGMLTPIIQASPPSWVMEGFADYEVGNWSPSDLMVVRDAVLTERMPYLSVDYDMLYPGGTADLGRAPYNLGHAAFEFIKDKYGEGAVRQFWFYMKKQTLLGGEDVVFSALGIKEQNFNEQFSEYLRKRFTDYREKESPIDYGKEISLPKKYKQIFSQDPSPDGKEFAVMVANYDDYEFDILKIDRTGKILKNLTGGFTSSYDYLTTDSWSFEGRNISWSADGRRVAFFARTGKRRSLFIFDANTGDRTKKIKMKLDQAASPAMSPDGRNVLFVADLNGQPDMFEVDLETGEIRNLTNDKLYEKTPMWSPDGKTIYYTTRIHARDQIMRMEASNTKQIEQLTFSDYNSTSPVYDPETNSVYYSADKGSAFNLYRLELTTGDKIQYSDVIGGNFSPVPFREDGKIKLAFTTFFKGQYRFFITELPKPVTVIAKGTEPEGGETLQKTVETAALSGSTEALITPSRVFPQQGPVAADFQPAKEVEVNKSEIHDKKFRAILSGRPEAITGVSGDSFAIAGGVSIGDILGDQEIQIFTSRISGFQSYYVGYLDLGHRLQYLSQFIFQDNFYYTPVPFSIAQQTGFSTDIVRSRMYGVNYTSVYPFNRYYRLELGGGIYRLTEQFYNNDVQRIYENILRETGAEGFLSQGGYLPLSVAFVGETTRFREWGPLAGHTIRISFDEAVPVANSWISRTIEEVDARKYFRINNRSLVAARARLVNSTGSDPVFFSFGGGQDLRGFDFREVGGNRGGVANLEVRLPLWPNPRIPVLGQLRGRVFTDYVQMKFIGSTRFEGFLGRFNYIVRDVNGQKFAYDIAKGTWSMGAGFTAFLGGLPFNFDFSKVYGPGRFLDQRGVVDPRQPTVNRFDDGIHMDFSIAFDF
jgi:Tol biopolymer transport system component